MKGMATSLAIRFLRGVTFLVRLDMAAAILIAAALFLWVTWH